MIALLYAAAALYAVATVEAISAARGERPGRLCRARVEAVLAVAACFLFLALQGARTGTFPITGALEAFVFLAAAGTLAALALDGLRGLSILVVATLPLSLATTLLALALTAAPAEESATNVSGLWTSIHVFVALGSYGAFALAFVTGVLYLVQQRHLKEHAGGSVLGLMPSLETVARINVRSLAVGTALLAAGLLVGYLQAHHDPAAFGLSELAWRGDPKIWLTTITLAAYLAVFVLSRRPPFKGRRTALASVLCFALVLATFWASVFWSGFHRFR